MRVCGRWVGVFAGALKALQCVYARGKCGIYRVVVSYFR